MSKIFGAIFMQIKSVFFKVCMIQGHIVEVNYDLNISTHLLLNVPSMSIPFHLQNGIMCFSEFYWVASTAFFSIFFQKLDEHNFKQYHWSPKMLYIYVTNFCWNGWWIFHATYGWSSKSECTRCPDVSVRILQLSHISATCSCGNVISSMTLATLSLL